MREAARVLRHRGNVDEAADIGATVAHEHADSGALAGGVALRRINGGGGQRAARGGEQGPGHGRGSAGFHDRFRDVLGLAERSRRVDARPRGLERPERNRSAEAVAVELDREPPAQIAHRWGYLHSHREHDHVELFLTNAVGAIAVAIEIAQQ